MASSSGPKLLQQAEKIFLHEIHPHLLAYCPTMDLIAVVTDEENLDVYRINGQRAFGLKRKNSSVTVDCICWQFNGQAIAIAWSDGYTDILSSETGKVIHPNVPAPSRGADTPRIQTIGWGLNFIDVESVKKRTGSRKPKRNGNSATIAFETETTDNWDDFGDDTSIEDFLARQPDLQALEVAPDLPDQLSMMDMENLMPKLPLVPLPPATPFMRPQADAGAFSTQAQVDSLLHSHQLKDHNSVDMFIRCTDDGTVHPSIYDSLETVNIRLPSTWPVDSSRPVLHTSHPYSCSHGLLTEVKMGSQSKLAFVPLTLGFVPSAGIYLHLIASKTSQLQNLLLYVQQCLLRIRTFWKHSRDLPSKFMRNIEETLEEKAQGNLVQSLYHLACTGHCPELLREWLVEELSESGHKRWDQTVVSSLTTVIQLLHENLLPAIDRCSIIISRLRGLAKYHDSGWIFNTPINDFTALLEQLKNLRLLGHTALNYAADEKRQFLAFSKWLRYEIDFQGTEVGSQSRIEMESKDPNVDITVVLDYINYGLSRSDLSSFFQEVDQLLGAENNSAASSSYKETVDAIELARQDATYKPEALCLEHVLKHVHTRCTKLFQQISHWQESNISMDCGLVLEENVDINGGEAIDMRMVYEATSTSNPLSSKERNDDPDSSISNLSDELSSLTFSAPQPIPTDPNTISTYILFVPSAHTSSSSENDTAAAHTRSHDNSDLHIHRLTHTPTITKLSQSLRTYAISTLHFPSATVLDAKFADDTTLLVLLQVHDEEKTCVILFLPYTPTPTSTAAAPNPTENSTDTQHPITYTPLPSTSHPTYTLPSGTPIRPTDRHTITFRDEEVKKYTRHVFESRFTPLKLVVNGRKGRRVVVVLGSDRKHFRVLDLDYGEKRGAEDVEEGGDGDESGVDVEEAGDVDVEMVGA